MRMRPAADLMWKGNPANGPVRKFLAVDEDTFRRSTIFISDKADQIAVVLIHGADTRGKGRFTAIAPFFQLDLP